MADPNAPASIDPFAKFDVGPKPAAPAPDAQTAEPAQPVANDNSPEGPPAPKGEDPFAQFDVGPAPSSATGAFVRGAVKSALPAVGGLAAAGTGAEIGGAAGLPLAPFTGGWSVPVLGVAGAIGGGIHAVRARITGHTRIRPVYR